MALCIDNTRVSLFGNIWIITGVIYLSDVLRMDDMELVFTGLMILETIHPIAGGNLTIFVGVKSTRDQTVGGTSQIEMTPSGTSSCTSVLVNSEPLRSGSMVHALRLARTCPKDDGGENGGSHLEHSVTHLFLLSLFVTSLIK